MLVVEKLAALRALMKTHGCDYYYVPSTDPHQNEYVPEVWQRRAWISDFTGSAGDVLVGMEQAYLWTDGRYQLQAQQQLDSSCFELMVQAQGVAPVHQWLQQHTDIRVGVDPKVISVAQTDRLQDALLDAGGELVSIDGNLVDLVSSESTVLPANPVTVWPESYAGLSAQEKIVHVQRSLVDAQCDAMALNMLDQIAWMFNVRGSDIDYNPLVISYALITPDAAHWFVGPEKINAEVREHCEQCGITLHDYFDIVAFLENLDGVVVMDPSTASWWMLQQIDRAEVAMAPCIIDMMKACKNPVEQAGTIEAHRVDGLALCRFMRWVETNWRSGITELSAAQQLQDFRYQHADCVGLSFNTISGFADHGAIIHYSATEASNKVVDDSNLYLVDSGGQYPYGTTDVTRTLHFGEPTPEQKTLYTAVLRGHIALSKLTFPHGTSGAQLDALARQFLWQQQWDYAHGTGHGVGSYLCVHEGPQRVSRAGSGSELELLPGMIISNEPGVYWPGQFGIRIENLCLVSECDGGQAHGFGPFYCLQTLTLAPYQKNLIDVSALDLTEIQWLNDYHQRVYDQLAAEMNEADASWLKQATSALSL